MADTTEKTTTTTTTSHPMAEKKIESGSNSDQERNDVYEATDVFGGEGQLHRQLKNRHIAMISIGGVIGTGLFLGTGASLASGGPVGLLL